MEHDETVWVYVAGAIAAVEVDGGPPALDPCLAAIRCDGARPMVIEVDDLTHISGCQQPGGGRC